MYKAYGKLINVKNSYAIHIVSCPILPFLDISLNHRHFLFIEMFNYEVCVQSLWENLIFNTGSTRKKTGTVDTVHFFRTLPWLTFIFFHLAGSFPHNNTKLIKVGRKLIMLQAISNPENVDQSKVLKIDCSVFLFACVCVCVVCVCVCVCVCVFWWDQYIFNQNKCLTCKKLYIKYWNVLLFLWLIYHFWADKLLRNDSRMPRWNWYMQNVALRHMTFCLKLWKAKCAIFCLFFSS